MYIPQVSSHTSNADESDENALDEPQLDYHNPLEVDVSDFQEVDTKQCHKHAELTGKSSKKKRRMDRTTSPNSQKFDPDYDYETDKRLRHGK